MSEFREPVILEMSSYVRPAIIESMGTKWVLNGEDNSFFQYIIDRYNGSPTNAALIDAYVDRIYGKGLSIVNADTNASEYGMLLSILNPKEVWKIVADFKMFGSSVLQIRYAKSTKRRIAKIEHLDRKSVGSDKVKKGVVTGYWISSDWGNVLENEPKFYPAFGTTEKANIEIYEIKPYKAGKTYYADPDYLAGLSYANLEEEISNFSINHIQNGLSAGYILNFMDGKPPEEKQEELEARVKRKLTGSNNAGKVILSWNDDPDLAPTVVAIPSNANHEQWQFWADEARQQLLVAHRVTTPMLFGVKDNTGLGNNAGEMREGSKLLHETTIRPKQNQIIQALQEIVAVNGLTSPLVFVPLEDEEEEDADKKEKDEKKETEEEIKEEETKLSAHIDDAADFLINLGEAVNDDWDVIDERGVEGHTLNESSLNALIQLSSIGGDSRKRSQQDTSLFKIRYKYAGSPLPERPFCQKLMLSNKVYRYEDLKAAESKVVNKGFGPNGANTYSIFLYKGGVNCKHWWQRVIYLKKGNKRLGVNEAKRMILELEPKDRAAAKWDENPKEVAKIADNSNNHWRLAKMVKDAWKRFKSE